MTQEDPNTYDVTKDEEVTFKITPMNGAAGERVTAAVDSDNLKNKGTNEAPVFSFKVTKDPEERHFAALSFTFVDGDPKDAHYKIKVIGSEGGDFEGNTVRKEYGDLQEPKYIFIVS